MDAYTYILDRLREDDFHRLRAFRGDGEDGLSRWLVVVSRRLCTDLWRNRYGRPRPSTPEDDLDARRRLVDALWEPRQPDELPAGRHLDPERELRHAELRAALESALADLEARDRLLLSYRFEDGLSARRISGLMEFPTPFHVYRRVNTLLKRLRRRLEDMGFDAADP
ncbi:MAG: sigma-70 family RNA polymerase sigma factor [Gemmatimonadota bacterium]|jgi:RNA polymerase sigma factor (sigma-70 family)